MQVGGQHAVAAGLLYTEYGRDEGQRPTGRVVSGAQRNLKVIAQIPDVRIVEYTLNPGHSHPWYHHTQVTDRIYCLEIPAIPDFGNPNIPQNRSYW